MKLLTNCNASLARIGLALACASLSGMAGAAGTVLADAPLYSTVVVPANVILDLSVEFPTAVGDAYMNVAYTPASEFVGYFNPNYCYDYKQNTGDDATYTGAQIRFEALNGYFQPAAPATGHVCSGHWSGNFLNWVLTQTIDPLRKTLTGGARIVDEANATVLQRAYQDLQSGGSNQVVKSVTNAATVHGATPFGSWSSIYTCNRKTGLNFVFSSSNITTCDNTSASSAIAYDGEKTAQAKYWAQGAGQVCTGGELSGSNSDKEGDSHVATAPDGSTIVVNGRCRPYGGNYKPVGLMQKYTAESTTQNDTIRYSAFGYMLDSAGTTTNEQLDGGVLRARMKSVGPFQADPGHTVVANPAREWDKNTGVFVANPDAADASASGVSRSGVANYLNLFGFVPTAQYTPTTRAAYKRYDSVSELLYMALRYYRNLGNLASHTSTATAITGGEATKDNFPVITGWDDPIKYACSTNYVIGIGDIHSWNDANLPGATAKGGKEVAAYAPTDDAAVRVSEATNYIANWEHLAGDTGGIAGRTNFYTAATNLGDALIRGIASPSGGWGASQNTFYMAGLAFDAHVRDIRPDITNKAAPITVSTFWLDVMESAPEGPYHQKNQFWMTSKYGSFDTEKTYLNPDGTYAPFPIALNNSGVSAGTAAAGLTYNTSNFPTPALATQVMAQSAWNSGGYVDDRKNFAPDQYYQAGSPAKMAAGLDNAFKKIAASVRAGTSSALGLGSSSVSTSGNVNYISQYGNNWTGGVRAQSLALTTAGAVLSTDVLNTTPIWDATAWLPPSSTPGALTSATRLIATSSAFGAGNGVPFEIGAGGITAAQKAMLGPSATFQQAVLDYVRGDACNEPAAGTALTPPCSGTSLGFRPRGSTVLGDITNSQPAVYGKPSLPYADTPLNPGYSAFKTANAARTPVLYVGANDGMLHAFDATANCTTVGGVTTCTAGPNSGKELFAYVPSALLTTNTDASGNPVGLASLTTDPLLHHFMVDAVPVVRDVDFARTNLATTDPTWTSKTPDWHTIVITGLGKGGGSGVSSSTCANGRSSCVGGGYVALDVTDPASITSETALAGKVLWETDPSTLPHMGFSYGLPHIIKTKKYGWTVALTSGYGNDDGRGYIYLINPVNGSPYEIIATGVGSAANPAGLTHMIASVPSASDFTADALYAGDLLGNVWRVDLSTTGAYVAEQFATLTDSAGVPQPVTTYPVTAIDPTKQTRYVFVGTGKLLSDVDLVNTQTQTFYAFIDGTASTIDTTGPFPIQRSDLVLDDPSNGLTPADLLGKRGFYMDLAPAVTAGPGTQASAERINVQMVARSGVVLFAANLFGQDICNKGSSRVFALNFDSGLTYGSDHGRIGRTLLQSAGSPPTLVSYLSYLGIVTNLTLVNGPASGAATSSSTLTAMWGLDTTTANKGPQSTAAGDILFRGNASLDRINWREVPESQ